MLKIRLFNDQNYAYLLIFAQILAKIIFLMAYFLSFLDTFLYFGSVELERL